MQVTGNKIFVIEEEFQTKSGIIAPNLKKQGFQIYKVAAVGPGERNPFTMDIIPVNVKVGDRIIADALTAPEITITKNNEKIKYHVISEKDIQVILDESETAA